MAGHMRRANLGTITIHAEESVDSRQATEIIFGDLGGKPSGGSLSHCFLTSFPFKLKQCDTILLEWSY